MGETGQSRRIKEIFIISGIYKKGASPQKVVAGAPFLLSSEIK